MTERTSADDAMSSLKTQLSVEKAIPEITALKTEHEERMVAAVDAWSSELLIEVYRRGFEAGIKLKSENPDL